MLDLHKLHIFAVVVQEGSFSAAAARLYITQSAVSQHMKDLENSLGQSLFQRGWRGVSLTPHGETLARYTTEIFRLVAEAEAALTDVAALTSGKVTIGATPGAGVYLIPDWMQTFRARYPQLTVLLQTGITGQIVADLLAHRLDVGVIEGELEGFTQARLQHLVLEEVEQVVVVGFRHPFWDATQLQIAELHQQAFIARQPSSQSRQWLDLVFRQHNVAPVIDAEFDNLESIKRAVAAGQAMTILPAYAVQTEVEQGMLRALPVAGSPFTRSLKLIWDRDTPFTPVTRAFLTAISAQYPRLAVLLNPQTR